MCDCAETGFEGDFCNQDMDECVSGLVPCDEHGTCTNTPGAYTCSCNPGFEGDGFQCDDVDECVEGTATCPAESTCANTTGSYECPCNTGFIANEETGACDDVDECTQESVDCGEDYECINLAGSYACECAPEGTPPTITLTSPARGAVLEGMPGPASLVVEGIVSDVGLDALFVNGLALLLPEGTSEFSLNTELDTQWGLNTV